MEKNKKTGIGFTGLLQILFIALKLTGFIDWSWIWVLSPIWISIILWVVIAVVIVLIDNKFDIL